MKAITHYFAYKHLKLILKEDCSIAEKKRMLRLLLRLYVPEQILANENPNHCSKCGRFSDGNTCDDCQSSASSETSKEIKEKALEEEAKKHNQEIKQIKAGYRGECSLEKSIAALKEGISHKDSYSNNVIFPHKLLTEHYLEGKRRAGNKSDPNRLKLLPYAIEATKKAVIDLNHHYFLGNRFPKEHKGFILLM